MLAFIIMILSIIAVIKGLTTMNLPLVVISIFIFFISLIPLNQKYLEKRRHKDE